MPFKSKRQQKWMFANDRDMAEKWAAETHGMKDLPESKRKSKKKKR